MEIMRKKPALIFPGEILNSYAKIMKGNNISFLDRETFNVKACVFFLKIFFF